MPEESEMSETGSIFPNDPSEVANMAADGGIPKAEVSTVNAWYDDPKYKDIKDEILQAKIMTHGEFARKYGGTFNPEDEYKDRFAGDDEVQEYFDKKLDTESGEGVKAEDKTEKRATTENKDNLVWVIRNGVYLKIPNSELRDGEFVETFLEGDKIPEVGDLAPESTRGRVESGDEEKKAREAEAASRAEEERQRVVAETARREAEERAHVEAERIRLEEEERRRQEEEERESALIERLRADEAFRKDCARVLGQYSGEGSAGGVDTFVTEFADLAGIDLTPLRGNPQQMWMALQNAYFTEILEVTGRDALDMRSAVEIKRQWNPHMTAMEQAKLVNDWPADKTVRIKGEFDNAARDFNLSELAKLRLSDWIRGVEVTKKEDPSDYGVIFKVFGGGAYPPDGYIGTDLDEILKKEPKMDLLKKVKKIHELAYNLDLSNLKAFEQIKTEYLEGADAALVAMLKIEKNVGGRQVAILPIIMEKYDVALRRIYGSGNIAVSIDSDDVKTLVDTELVRIIPDETERKLFMRMGRDLCRITALDAQFGYSENDKKIKLPSNESGSFLRGLICFNDYLIGEGKDKRLIGSIDIGTYSFWNKMREVKSSKTEPLTAREINEIVRNKLSTPSQAPYMGWLNSFNKPSLAKRAEGEFTEKKTLDSFIAKLPEAYAYKEEARSAYLLERLKSCMGYFVEDVKDKEELKINIENQFLKDGKFDGKEIFKDPYELRKFFWEYGININIDEFELQKVSKSARDAARSFRSLFGLSNK